MNRGAYVSALLPGLLLVLQVPETSAGPPALYNATVIAASGGVCPETEQKEDAVDQIVTDVRTLLNESFFTPCGTGWTRVVSLDTGSREDLCPGSWRNLENFGRCAKQNNVLCDPERFPTGREYRQVCGRAIGHQIGNATAFNMSSTSIDDAYVDGISIAHGEPRVHIWTFAAGTYYGDCPCDRVEEAPPFVGESYFCEAIGYDAKRAELGDSPLWDGVCEFQNDCCNSSPWFSVTLPAPTMDDIEVRICFNRENDNERVYLEALELYVK